MATLLITEYTRMARDSEGNIIPVGEEPAIAEQALTYTTSSQSAALNRATRFVLLKPDATAYIEFGESPTATTSNQRLEANQEHYRGVKEGAASTMLIAAYDGTS